MLRSVTTTSYSCRAFTILAYGILFLSRRLTISRRSFGKRAILPLRVRLPFDWSAAVVGAVRAVSWGTKAPAGALDGNSTTRGDSGGGTFSCCEGASFIWVPFG